MQKRQSNNSPNRLQEQQIHEQQMQNEEQSVNSGRQKKGRKARKNKDKSIESLTKKFIKFIKSSENGIVDLKFAVKHLEIPQRRIYDIIIVLESMNYIQKLKKNTVRWLGKFQDPQIQRDIAELHNKIDNLNQEQARIDKKIEVLTNQLKNKYLSNQQMKKYQNVTEEDVHKIYKHLIKDTQKSLVVISAHKGTRVEIGEQMNGEKTLKMDTMGNGRIKVFNCNTNGIQQVQLKKM